MKSYTDLEQSKKLVEILPVESADFHFSANQSPQGYLEKPIWGNPEYADYNAFPCWSLAALLSVLPYHLIVCNIRYEFSMYKGLNKNGETYMISYNNYNTDLCLYETFYYNNPVDAAFELVIWLKENEYKEK